MPQVSIAIPCYNNPEDMARLLNSISIQTYDDYEIVISDDSTEEGAAERIRSLVDAFTRQNASVPITYVHNSRPLGHVHNWNQAIRLTKGAYIKIMFSDDWFSCESSLSQYAAMLDAHPEAILAFSGDTQSYLREGTASASAATHETDNVSSKSAANVPDIDPRIADNPVQDSNRNFHDTQAQNADSHKIGSSHRDYDRAADSEYIAALQKDYRTLFLSNLIGAPSVTIYRRTEPLILFDERSGFASDVFLYMALLSQNPTFVSTDKPLVHIGLHERQYTETFDEKDPRIYEDYRTLYLQYRLYENPEMQEYFIRRYFVPYHKDETERAVLQLSKTAVQKAKRAERFATAKSLLHAGLSRFKSEK
ncbi:Glycosyl transferase family 2 [Lachnospiraceae bacterium NK3A20]|nr:Glycosyl transferase family 2 [Lachnospiraceae bacterium NK3A20]